jgi:hypothetical protein
MRQTGQRGRTDGNHADVIKALEGIGATVRSLAAVGGGVPDLLVGFRQLTLLMEVKDGTLTPSRRQLTADQVKFFDTWAGQACVAYSPEMAVLQVQQAARKLGAFD